MKSGVKKIGARALDLIERAGNRLPDPITLFFLLALLVVAASWVASAAGWSAIHPGTGKVVEPVSLASAAGVRRMFGEAVKNFTSFPPLGTVLVVMLGIGAAEKSGLVAAGLRQMVSAVPPWAITTTLVFVSVNASLAADAGLVILPPLGAVLFLSLGRHPLAGLAAAYAGVSGGFSANLLLTALDPLLAGLTESAARMIDPSYRVLPTANYWFMAVSVGVLTVAGTFVTTRIVEPRLGKYTGDAAASATRVAPHEQRGLALAVFAFLTVLAIAAAATIAGPLRGPDDDPYKPLFDALVPIMAIAFFVPGLVYGVASGSIRSDKDAAKLTAEAMSTMGGYIVLAFAAAQFIAYFGWSNLGVITAVKGAELLRSIGLTGIPLLLAFIAFAMFMDLFVASSSAKWAVMAPVFVPMLMLLGYSPETTQAAYRVADSCANIVTPCMPYFPLIMAFAQKYDPKAGIGTLIALALPYTVVFALSWTGLLAVWLAFDLPFGPGVPTHWSPP